MDEFDAGDYSELETGKFLLGLDNTALFVI